MNYSLPANKKEELIYGSIICALTCTFMASMNIFINMGGITKESSTIVLKSLPVVFIIAMLLEGAVIGKIAERLTSKYSASTDSFNAQILFRTFFTVCGMSVIMTLVGGVLGEGVSIEVLKEFPHAWPRNFCAVFLLELLLVQPFARKVMRMMHGANNTVLSEEV